MNILFKILIATGLLVAPIEASFANVTQLENKKFFYIQWVGDFQKSPVPLTTAEVWEVDPGESNPHRVRWVLERDLTLKGVEVVKGDGGGYRLNPGVQVVYRGVQHLRGDGPWYFSEIEIPCFLKVGPGPGTKASTELSAHRASQIWKRAIEGTKGQLEARLGQIRGQNPKWVEQEVWSVFFEWQRKLEKRWRESELPRLLSAELQENRKLAAEYSKMGKGYCPRSQALSIRDLVEPPEPVQGEAELKTALRQNGLVRAPAKRLTEMAGTQMSVRVSIDFAGQRLNGRFYLDPTLSTSQVDLAWLNEQGVPEFLLNAVKRSALLPSRVEISGLLIPLKRFDVSRISPLHEGVDGVLGADFFREFIVGLDPQNPASVRLWARTGFNLGEKFSWIEIHRDSNGAWVSDCESGGQSFSLQVLNSSPNNATHNSYWVRWTGAEIFQNPVRCGGVWVGELYTIDSKNKKNRSQVSLNKAYLGSDFRVLDMAHGRLWLREPKLSLKNKSPL